MEEFTLLVKRRNHWNWNRYSCLFRTLGYINILAEYLHNNLKKEGLTHILAVRMPQRINVPDTPNVNERPILSVVERVNLEVI